MKKILMVSFIVLAFAVVGFSQEHRPTKTYYNNKVSYKSMFENFNPNQLKVQVRTPKGKRVQAEIPVVNDSDKDITQKKEGK